MTQDENRLRLNRNWVKERYACSVAQVFAELKMEISADIEAANSLRPAGASYGFKFVPSPSSANAFSVLREHAATGEYWKNRTIVFSSDGKEILAKSEEKEILRATLTINDEGECRFMVKINGQDHPRERDSWHVRKMALEDVFFVGI